MRCKIIINKCLHCIYDLIIFSVEFLMSKESNVSVDDVNVPKITLDQVRKHIVSPFTFGEQLIDIFFKKIFHYFSLYINKLILIVKIMFSFFSSKGWLTWIYIHVLTTGVSFKNIKIGNQWKSLWRCMSIALSQLLQ